MGAWIWRSARPATGRRCRRVGLLTQLSGCFDELVKLVEDGGLDGFDDPGLVGFVQAFETFRNRLPLIDHRVIRDAASRDLPGTLTQSTMNRSADQRCCGCPRARRPAGFGPLNYGRGPGQHARPTVGAAQAGAGGSAAGG